MRYLFEDLVLDTDRRELRRGGGLVSVEPQVFDILSYLIRNRDRVVSRDDLFNAIWDGRIVSDSALTARIFAARQAIGDRGDQQRFIKTLLRKGFRFVGVVREENEPKASAVSEIVPGTKRTIALPDRPSIAVLPFANMSGDLDQEYFADGMAEEIITALSRCNWLFVIARNSSFTYKGKAVDVRQVGPELGVRYIVEGSVRRAGDRLRITAQLVDAISGVHLWADRFEGGTSDVFELQDRITESVVATIEPKLQIAEIERLRHKAAPDLDAYDLLLRAQALEYEFTEESLASSLRCLEQALAIDPSYAPAMALAAYCYAQRHHQGWGQRPDAEADEADGRARARARQGRCDSIVDGRLCREGARRGAAPRKRASQSFAAIQSEFGHRLDRCRLYGSGLGESGERTGTASTGTAAKSARSPRMVHDCRHCPSPFRCPAIRTRSIGGLKSISPKPPLCSAAAHSGGEPCEAWKTE